MSFVLFKQKLLIKIIKQDLRILQISFNKIEKKICSL